MAARLNDSQKKKIIADAALSGNYSETARRHGISESTVRRLYRRTPEITRIAEQKKQENTADMLNYMESRKEKAKTLIDALMSGLQNSEKIDKAKLSEVATTLGIIIDKFVIAPQKHEIDKKRLEVELARADKANDMMEEMQNMLKSHDTLAEIIRKPAENRDISDFE